MTPRPASGFTLIEVVLALGFCAFCLLTIIGLLPIALNTHRDATATTVCSLIVSGIEADLRATPHSYQSTSPRYGLRIPAAGEPGSSPAAPETLFLSEDGSAADRSHAWCRVSLWFNPPAANQCKTATMLRILVSWPAAKPVQWPAPSRSRGYHTVIAMDRNQ